MFQIGIGMKRGSWHCNFDASGAASARECAIQREMGQPTRFWFWFGKGIGLKKTNSISMGDWGIEGFG